MAVTLGRLQADADAISAKGSPTIRKFAQDMVAYLKQQPVVASPPPTTYGRGFSAHIIKLGAGAAGYMGRLTAAKARVIRDDTYPGTSNANLDTIGSLCAANGITRAHGGGLVLITWGGGAPPSNATMQSWATTLVNYMETNYPGVLLAIEPANEPNNNSNLTAAATYAAFNNAVYDGVKAASSVVKVWGGATSGSVARWAGPAIDAGAKFDEWSCHPYPAFDNIDNVAAMLSQSVASAWSEFNWVTDSSGQTLLQALSSRGYAGPVHGTEFGVPTKPPSGSCPRTSTEATQAAVFAQGYATWRAISRAGHLLFYTGQDDDTNGQVTEEDHYGAFHTDGTEKPVVAAMQAA